jgi:hypothetical protein
MRERIERAWRWLSQFGTVVTLGSVSWWLLSAGGGIAMSVWVADQLTAPVAASIGLLTFAALLWIRYEFVRWKQERNARKIVPLYDLRSSGVALLGRVILIDSELPEWEASVDEWRHEVGSALECVYGKSTAHFVAVLDTYDPKQTIVGSLNARHNQMRVMLHERIKRLELVLANTPSSTTAAATR